MKVRHRIIAWTSLTAAILVWPLAGAPRTQTPTDMTVVYALFKDPPGEYMGHYWFAYNLNTLTDATVIEGIRDAVKTGAYGGFMITPSNGGSTALLSDAYLKASGRQRSDKGVVYLSEEYFRLYKLAIQEGLKYNFPLSVLYDELEVPSGMVGGQFYSKYPQDAAKSLEKVEKDATGPAKVQLEIPIPTGIYVGAVMMNRDTRELTDISSQKTATGGIAYQVPKGNWKVMLFYMDPTFRPASRKGGFCDYLDAGAVDKFIAMSYQKYYDHLKEYFGTTIKMSFHDEPAMHLNNGRMWTPGFNQAFTKKYGYSPMKYYPALWYDISPETAAVRNALFGFRAELYAENYIGRSAAWCAAHGIDYSGHQDQEEARNPVAINGDLMKLFEHQQIPAVDDVYFSGRSNVSYKIVSSASYNYDRPITMAETYAAYREDNAKIAYRTAMDQYVMGVNLQIGTRASEAGPELGRYIGRMSYLLRHGRHVTDIAMLYPIASLQTAYKFASPLPSARRGSDPDFEYALEGGIVPPETDYMDLGELLFRGLRIDYTYLHPEVLESKCLVDKGRLILDNKENREEFRVLILPGGDTISADVARKVLEFYQAGGTIIATHKLPSKSAEFKRDKEVQQMVAEVFGIPFDEPMTAEIRTVFDDFKTYFAHPNKAGGKAFFLPQPDPNIVNTVLKEAVPVRDVDIQQPPMWPVKMDTAYDGALTYLHKVKDSKDIYFFVNSMDTPVDTKVVLRGNKSLGLWNPHTGDRLKADTTQGETGGQAVTTMHLVLGPLKSVFYVQE
jgi:hypothetical protein